MLLRYYLFDRVLIVQARSLTSSTPFPYTTLFRSGLAALKRAEELSGALGPYALQAAIAACHARARTPAERSEEHTSELQSHHDLVCRLLLEKKKKTQSSQCYPVLLLPPIDLERYL